MAHWHACTLYGRHARTLSLGSPKKQPQNASVAAPPHVLHLDVKSKSPASLTKCPTPLRLILESSLLDSTDPLAHSLAVQHKPWGVGDPEQGWKPPSPVLQPAQHGPLVSLCCEPMAMAAQRRCCATSFVNVGCVAVGG